MSFLGLVWLNVVTHKVRSAVTIAAVAIALMTVVTLGVLTHSLLRTATGILMTGKADFTIAQKGVSDVLYSVMDDQDIQRLTSYQGMDQVIGVLVGAAKLDGDHPFFLRIGIDPAKLQDFGVDVLAGRAFVQGADNEMMLGWRSSQDLHKGVGDQLYFPDLNQSFDIVGIYSTGQVFGDSASMFSLTNLQGIERKPGTITLGFARVKPGTDIDSLRSQIDKENPQLATVKTESDFGRVDRNLALIQAADMGVLVMALFFGAVGVSITMMMSVFERTREFGVLRAIGWTRLRVLAMVVFEAFTISLVGAFIGCGVGPGGVYLVRQVPELRHVFEPDFTSDVFGRAIGIAIGMAFIGGFIPALRAAFLVPLEALRHE